MKKQLICFMSAVIIITCLASSSYCDISSDNYRIPTYVFSGGGLSMISADYNVDSTLAQPAPLGEPGEPPESLDYVLYPGFWYTVDGKVGIQSMPWLILLLDQD